MKFRVMPSAETIRARAQFLAKRAGEISLIPVESERRALWIGWERDLQILRVEAKRAGVAL